ncbi:beta-alanine-activating enzyme isoform X1 [Pelobates fuscus]|uniref:beta-alanine-activating enzyme isoform X1 n=2 Tax=Pelobates fuscus TaxID=191477 RepID=UPI002FE4EA9C
MAAFMAAASSHCTLHEMVLKAAAQHEDRHAVCFHPIKQQPLFLTYRELTTVSGELTAFLKLHCLDTETCRIGLYCHPGIHLPCWIMGILCVPAAYCPIDPGSPSHFTSSLMERCKLNFILVENNKVKAFKMHFTDWTEQDSNPVQHLGVTLFKVLNYEESCLGKRNGICGKQATSAVENKQGDICKDSIDIREECLAYILHTSGTTGAPKIVSVPHKCIVPNIEHLRSIFNILPSDLLFLASSLTFDPSVVELFLALSSGACILVVPDAIRMISTKLCDVLFNQHRVTVLQLTPTLLRRFGSHSIRSSVLSRDTSLRILALGGEPFPAVPVLRSWREHGNKTRIFNLYGITEVSSWATYFEIPETILLNTQIGNEPLVPLGSSLHGTIIEVRNDEDCAIEKGEGQVFLGGQERVCFLDEEVVLPYGTLRNTGDWVTIKDGEMFLLGRKDNQIKRHGKRLNMEYVQQVVENLAQVETCAVLWFEARQLILFVVPREPVEKKSLWKELRTCLLSYAVPDDLVLIESLPFTKHGKVDMSQLNRLYTDYVKERRTATLLQREDLWDALESIWKSLLNLPDGSSAVANDSMFLLSGGNSLMALRFQGEVETLVGKSVPGLVEVLLNGTFMDIHRQIYKCIYPMVEKASIVPHIEINTIRTLEKGNHAHKRNETTLTDPEKHIDSFISLSRGNRIFINVHLASDSHAQKCQWTNGSSIEVAEFLKTDDFRSECKRQKTNQSSSSSFLSQDSVLSSVLKSQFFIRVKWKSDTGKCVDATPLLIQSASTRPSVTVYIGSHSHRVQALHLKSGEVIWERVLGDRVESSAAVSRCGSFVLIGCYNGSLYVLNRHDGKEHWIFSTKDAIKSSPTIDPLTGLVFFGSHDHHLYALDINVKQCIWKSFCGGGAVFSSPCISSEPYILYTATLGGFISASNPSTGDTLWRHACGKPVFASPQCNTKHVLVGCVDENFYCFSHSGEKVWHITTSGPIFSSPCISSISQKVIFGSHDGSIYCCDMEGVLLWKYKTSSRVYSTPFVFPHPHTQNMEFVAAASTDGNVWVFNADSGLLDTVYKLDGEVFSSPVVWGNYLVIGCRNDYVYCLDLMSSRSSI